VVLLPAIGGPEIKTVLAEVRVTPVLVEVRVGALILWYVNGVAFVPDAAVVLSVTVLVNWLKTLLVLTAPLTVRAVPLVRVSPVEELRLKAPVPLWMISNAPLAVAAWIKRVS
jgi:hypothetical protein